MLDNVLQINMSLSPSKMYCLFYINNLLRNLSFTLSHTDIDLKGAPNGGPR